MNMQLEQGSSTWPQLIVLKIGEWLSHMPCSYLQVAFPCSLIAFSHGGAWVPKSSILREEWNGQVEVLLSFLT